MPEIEIVRGDITEQDTDAIANAANSALAPGGGVDGAIRRAAGASITEETARIGGCPIGGAVATGAGNLRARHVVHAVGPVWTGGDDDEDELLESAYRRACEVAAALGCRSIAFPAISTGSFGFPLERAAPIALRAVADARLDLVRFVLFSDEQRETFERALGGEGA